MNYTVSLGYETVEVKAETYDEAIHKGRMALCMMWPRLWDVIMGKPDAKFVVRTD